jgi:competence protein ComEC
VTFGAGIALWFSLPWRGEWLAATACAAGAALAGAALGGRAGRLVMLAGLLFAAGVATAWWRAESVAAPRLERSVNAQVIEGRVLEVEILGGRDRTRLTLAPMDPALPPKLRVSVRGTAAVVERGQTVRLRASLQPPAGPAVPGGYDFAQRAWFAGVGATGYALGEVVVVAPAPAALGPVARLAEVRSYLTARMQTAVGGDEGGVAAALVTGDTGGIPEQVTQDWRDSGLAHLLSISGLHIAVVVGGTMWLVRRLLTLSMWIALRWPVKTIGAAVGAVAGIAYTLLAGAEVPTVRSCLAVLVVLLGLAIGRQALSMRTVAFAAMIIMIFRPEAVMGPSFQLSFAAVAAIVLFYDSPLGRRVLTRGDSGLALRAFRAFVGLLISGLVVEFALMPIALSHFGRTGVYGMFANLVGIPFSSFVVMPALAMALLLDLVGLAQPAFAVLKWSIGMLNWLAAEMATMPGAVTRAPSWMPGVFALIALGGVWLALWRSRARWLGLAPLAVGLGLAAVARPADLLVSADGRHAAITDDDGTLALLRPQAGDFIADMWGDAAAAQRVTALDISPQARCSRDACVAVLRRGGRDWSVLATRSRTFFDRKAFAALCGRVDIAISDRKLPLTCTPRWLKLDAPALRATGAVAIRFSPLSVRTVAAEQGDHPWRSGPTT